MHYLLCEAATTPCMGKSARSLRAIWCRLMHTLLLHFLRRHTTCSRRKSLWTLLVMTGCTLTTSLNSQTPLSRSTTSTRAQLRGRFLAFRLLAAPGSRASALAAGAGAAASSSPSAAGSCARGELSAGSAPSRACRLVHLPRLCSTPHTPEPEQHAPNHGLATHRRSHRTCMLCRTASQVKPASP